MGALAIFSLIFIVHVALGVGDHLWLVPNKFKFCAVVWHSVVGCDNYSTCSGRYTKYVVGMCALCRP